MRRFLVGALLIGTSPILCNAIEPAVAQGVTIGPGGIGVDPGPRYRDDREYDRERYRRDDSDDDRPPPRRRHRRDDDDDQ